MTIHETSPVNRGASKRLFENCSYYIQSQFFTEQPIGNVIGDVRCENLESLTFADDSIDLHISQDVLEHIFHPSKAFREIARTLKPGGAHIFTVPIVNKQKPSKLRVRISNDGKITHIESPEYHSNPINDKGSLVTVNWGFDICQHIFDSCGLFTHIIYIDDLSIGVRAEFIEVLVTVKRDGTDKQDSIP